MGIEIHENHLNKTVFIYPKEDEGVFIECGHIRISLCPSGNWITIVSTHNDIEIATEKLGFGSHAKIQWNGQEEKIYDRQ